MPQILNDSPTNIDLFVRSRTKTFFEGQVRTLTSINETGEFDILPMHANFITLIKNFVILDKGLPTENKIEFTSAVLSVIGGKINIYIGI